MLKTFWIILLTAGPTPQAEYVEPYTVEYYGTYDNADYQHDYKQCVQYGSQKFTYAPNSSVECVIMEQE